MQDDITRPPPSAIMAEKALLSCLMKEPQHFVARGIAEGLSDESFSTEAMRYFFRCIVDDFRTHGDVEMIAFVQRRSTEGILDRMGGSSGVVEIFTYAPSAGGWSQWLGQVKEAHALRLAQGSARRLFEAENSSDATAEVSAVLEAIRKATEGPGRSVSAKDATREFLAQLDASYKAGSFPGKETGFADLDHLSGGMKPGEFWNVAAKTSRGKSVLMLQIAAEFLSRGENVALFTLEMGAPEIIGRLVSLIGRVDYSSITQPRTASTTDLPKIRGAAEIIAAHHLWIDASAGQTLDSIRAEAQRLRDMHAGLALVVVDYLQLVGGNRGRNETRELEIAGVSRGLKQLAKEMACPVLSGSQLNETGQVRESRAIEQDSDALLFITEDGIKIGKLRNGPRNTVMPLFLDGARQRFTPNPKP